MFGKFKKVLFFAFGDSKDPGVWSNVPYCFSTALERIGIEVVRVNLNPNPKMEHFWNNRITPLLRKLYPNCQYEYFRTFVAGCEINHIIKRAVKFHSDADYCIFMTFSYVNKFNRIPSMLFCDWTYDILIHKRLQRKPYFFERRVLSSERQALKRASMVFSMFPVCAQSIQERMKISNIKHGGVNATNFIAAPPNEGDYLSAKQSSNIVLFIGSSKYLEGARMVAAAMTLLRDKYPELEFHCIGLTTEQLMLKGIAAVNVYCYGYLNKGVPCDCQTYYDLLKRAKVICNPTPGWSGYSSTIEAMYAYIPIVVSRYDDFVAEFGQKLDFGVYNDDYTPVGIANDIESVIGANNYLSLCKSAHHAVENRSWDTYVENLLNQL